MLPGEKKTIQTFSMTNLFKGNRVQTTTVRKLPMGRSSALRNRMLQIESLEGRAMLAASLLTLSTSHDLISNSASYAADITTNMAAGHAASEGTTEYGLAPEASVYGSSVRMVSFVQPEGEGDILDTHPVRLDAQNKLLPWFTPEDKAYGHVSKLSADFIKAAMVGPIDPANGLPAIYTHSEYHPTTFVGSGWPNHPAGRNSMIADSMALYYAYSGDSGVLDAAKALLDYQLSSNGTTPSTYAWPNVPWSTSAASNPVYGTDNVVEGVGILEPDKVGELGINGYLRFYKITGDVRYLNAAIACADALATHVRVGNAIQSPWPYRVNAQTGAVQSSGSADYSAHVIAPIQLFDELIRLNQGNVAAYQAARTTAWNWMMTYPMVNNNWTQYFEDVNNSSNPHSNKDQYSSGQTARYLLERPDLDPNWQTHVQGLISYIETNFGGTDQGEPGLQYGARVISEQNAYKFKMASHTSRFAAVNAIYAARTGDLVAKEKAFRSFNWSSYMARSTGSVIEGPTEFAANQNNWYSDGHGEYIRHFMLGMNAFPEWAPASENHIVGSTSVIKSVTYPTSGTSVYYATFDADSKETLRISFIPTAVTVNGVALDPRSDLTQPGWMFDSTTGVLKIWHTTGTNIQIAGVPDTVPPTQPTNLSSPSKTYNSVNLTWTASIDNILVAGYDIYRDEIKVGTTSTTNYSDSGLTPSTAYSYTIQAVDIAGNVSTPSVALVVTTDPPDTQPPTKPSGLNVTDKTATRLTLNWSLSTDNYGVTRYDVFRNGVQVGSSSSTSYNDIGLTALTNYTYTVRAFDAAGNGSTTSDPLVVTTNGIDPLSFWNGATPSSGAADADTSAVELGVKFRTDVAGTVTAIKFYKAANNTGTHTGKIWTATGTQLASGTFTNETASGWQTLILSSPVSILANTTYIASYHAPVGRYWASNNFFSSSGVINGELRALQNGVDGGNGVYAYGPSSFPNQSYQSTNYWVDVVFLPDGGAVNNPPTVSIPQIAPNPRTTPIASIDISFSKIVSGFDLADLTLKRDNGANLLTGAQTLTTSNGGLTWTLGNLSGITTAVGAYVLTLTAAGSGIVDTQSLPLFNDGTTSWTVTASPTVSLNVNGSQQFQTIDGYGVNVNSLSWNNGELTPALDQLVDGLGASIFRTIIDETDWETVNDNSDPNVFNWTYYNTVYSSPKFQEFWNTLQYLNHKGIVSGLMLNFMGRTPVWMGPSDQSGLSVDPSYGISQANEDEFVEMIASVVFYARNMANIQFSLLAPMNEPNWDQWEGPAIPSAQYARILNKLAIKLDAIGLSDIRFVGPDGARTITDLQDFGTALFAYPAVMAKLHRWAIHSYSNSVDGAQQFISRTAYPNIRFWVTETANFSDAFGQIQHGSSSHLVWEGFESVYNHAIRAGRGTTAPNDLGNGPALLDYNEASGVYTPVKAFYEHAQLIKFVRSGAIRIGATDNDSNLETYAFSHPTTGQLTIVGRNTASNSIIVSGTLASLSGTISTLELYQTNASQNLAQGTNVTVTGGAFSVTIPANTYFTLVTPAIPDSDPPTAPANLTATNGFGQVQLSWNASTDNIGVAGYNVYRSATAGFTPSSGNLIAQTVGLTTTFTNSVVAGNYYYRVLASDAAGNLSPSSNEVLGTSQSDTTAPTVALTAPADNATVSGSVSITANASDNIAVAGVSFFSNGDLIGAEDTTAPYSVSWITSTNSNGSYVLTAVARDSSGNQTTSSSRTVTVQNSTSTVGLVAEWSFDDGSGTTAQDDSGNGHTGTISNAAWSATGKYGGALAFNGSNSWVTVADAAFLDLTTGMTIEAWVNPTSLTGWRSILLKERTGGLAYSMYATNPDLGSLPPGTFINLGAASDINSSGTQALPLNTWTHLAGTYDGSQLKMYVNGSLLQTINASGSITVSNGVLRIGGNSVYGEYFAGLIDEIRLYNRALALAEIQTNMNTPVNPPASIIGRRVFYNRSTSAVFGSGSGNPINAIDPTKQALLPGQTTTVANYTNYSRGLNGILVDIANATNLSGITAASFQFATWSAFPDSTPNFVTITPSVIVSTFAGGGLNGSDRVKLEFPNNAIQNAWLRVTMLADANTGLAANDVFYFGNARFDVTPTSPFPSQQVVINAFDVNAIRARQGQDSGIISNIYDVDRSGVVNAFDTNAVRANQGVASLRSFTAPSSLQFGLASSRSNATTSFDANFADMSWLETFQTKNSKNRPQMSPANVSLANRLG
jgi:chitodextrinase